MTKKLPLILISSFLGILLIGSIIYFSFIAPLQLIAGGIQYTNQCSPPLEQCPSGYTQDYATCVGLECTRACIKTIEPFCNTIYTQNNVIATKNLVASDMGKEFSNVFATKTNKCYKYSATSKFTITNRHPISKIILGVETIRKSDSHRIWTSSEGTEDNACFSQNALTVDLNTHNLGRGNGEVIAMYTKINSFVDTNCKTASQGSEGTLNYGFYVQESQWVTDLKDRQVFKCTFECSSASDCSEGTSSDYYCSGNSIVQDVNPATCSNYKCGTKLTTNTIQDCDYGCTNGVCDEKPADTIDECTSGNIKCEGESYHVCYQGEWDKGEKIDGKCGVGGANKTQICNNNGICETGESFSNCESDCDEDITYVYYISGENCIKKPTGTSNLKEYSNYDECSKALESGEGEFDWSILIIIGSIFFIVLFLIILAFIFLRKK